MAGRFTLCNRKKENRLLQFEQAILCCGEGELCLQDGQSDFQAGGVFHVDGLQSGVDLLQEPA